MLKLTEADVKTIRSIHTLRRNARDKAYWAELHRLEASLSPDGHTIYSTWPSERLNRELARWRDLYWIEKTRQGYRVRPFLRTAKRYAKTPFKARLAASELAPYRGLIRI